MTYCDNRSDPWCYRCQCYHDNRSQRSPGTKLQLNAPPSFKQLHLFTARDHPAFVFPMCPTRFSEMISDHFMTMPQTVFLFASTYTMSHFGRPTRTFSSCSQIGLLFDGCGSAREVFHNDEGERSSRHCQWGPALATS